MRTPIVAALLVAAAPLDAGQAATLPPTFVVVTIVVTRPVQVAVPRGAATAAVAEPSRARSARDPASAEGTASVACGSAGDVGGDGAGALVFVDGAPPALARSARGVLASPERRGALPGAP